MKWVKPCSTIQISFDSRKVIRPPPNMYGPRNSNNVIITSFIHCSKIVKQCILRIWYGTLHCPRSRVQKRIQALYRNGRRPNVTYPISYYTLRRVNSDTVSIAVVGSTSERLRLWEALYKWINTIQYNIQYNSVPVAVTLFNCVVFLN